MIARLFASALLVAGLSQAALAQTNTRQNQTNTSQNQDQTSAENTQAPRVPELLRERLSSAGFSDINVVPRSLVIAAKDQAGRPVLMRITPNSMFFLTEIASVSSPMASAANQGTQQDQASTSAENTQSPARNVPQSATTGVARGGSNDNAQQDQASTSAENMQAPSQEASSQNAPQSLRDRLASAGFTDVTIVPSSLVITAKDQSDRPVMMHVTPRSIAFLTEVPAVNSSSTTGAENSGDSGQRK
jgi:hypothetical protein